MPLPLATSLPALVLHLRLLDDEPQGAALLVVDVDDLLLAGDLVADDDRREILVVLLAVQDQADIDVEQAQQAALVGIVVGAARCRKVGGAGIAAIARLLGRLLVGVDRVFLADGLAEQPDLAGLDRRR